MQRMRGRRLASGLTLCLMALCWTMPAGAQELTSPAKSEESLMVPLETCLEEVARLELECVRRLTQQEQDFALLLYESNQKAAAEAVRAVMVELAGVEAERDAARRDLRRWRVGTIGAVGVAVLCVILAVAGAVQ